MMPEDYTDIDKEILEAIQSFDGIPNVYNLSKKGGGPLPYSRTLLTKRVTGNPVLEEALEDKGIEFAETCDRKTFDFMVSSPQMTHLTEKVIDAVHKRLDKYILEAIQSHHGIPNPYNLAAANGGPLQQSKSKIGERLKENSSLGEAREKRAVEFIKNCNREAFNKLVATIEWCKTKPPVRELIEQRRDGYILEAIHSFDGIPTANNISKVHGGSLEYSPIVITKRIKKNPILKEALEIRAMEFILTCDADAFAKFLPRYKYKLTKYGKKLIEAIEKRLDDQILEAIHSYEGIPNLSNLTKKRNKKSLLVCNSVKDRFAKNPVLQEALETRGVEFVWNCSWEVFHRSFWKKWSQTTGKVREAIDKRIDNHILESIQNFDGFPSVNNLCKTFGGPVDFSLEFVRSRFKDNPVLQNALENKGIEFIETCDRDIFANLVTDKILAHTKGKVREAIDKRIDNHILEAIRFFEGIPKVEGLSKTYGGPLEYGHSLIGKRLRENPELRRAYFLKRGLTEDQINALEVEHNNLSSAFVESIKRRLPNTRIFREALGILKQFRTIFEEKSLEVSFYPKPLGKAAEMLETQITTTAFKAHSFKRVNFQFETEGPFNSVTLLQCCHRFTTEALINIFNEVNRILAEAGVLLISLPEQYSRTTAFESQVQDFGFELKSEGTLYTRTLTIGELSALGVEEPHRLKQKIEQATNIIMLVKTRPVKGKELDGFVRSKSLNGTGEFVPSMDEINTPTNLLLELSSIFQQKTRGLDEAFILTVLDDSTYDERHIIGYDVNPKSPKTIEAESKTKPVLSKDEISKLSKELLDSSFQEKVLVRSGRETKIPARMVTRALRK